MNPPSLPLVFAFAVAGAAGALSRWGVNELVYHVGGEAARSCRLGTGIVNLLGCFAYGIGYGLLPDAETSSWRLILLAGFLGAFTTFSAFAADTLQLAKDGSQTRALVNIAVQVIFGIAALWLGMKLTTR